MTYIVYINIIMVKATRRVKRVKRSKKQVHHGRRKTNRRRYTRRQRGGIKIPVCETIGRDFLGNSKGIAITYDTDSQKYTIGNHPYARLKTMNRYIDALSWVELMFNSENIKPPDDKPVVLNQDQFDSFKRNYCPQGSTKPECGSITGFNPRAASAAPVAAASATDTDSNKILIKREGVQFGSIFKQWSADSCKFDENEMPFTEYVFTAQKYPPSVIVKYVMSPSSKTFCALAKYATEDGSLDNIDFSLVSPSVTITFKAKNVEPWDIASEFGTAYTRIVELHRSCDEPYTGSYKFYQEEYPFIATLFFTKPPEVVYTPIVYQNNIQNLINSCVGQIRLNRKLFSDEVTNIVTELEKFKQRLKELRDDPKPNLEALKTLDNEVNAYVRVTFQRLLVQTTKDQSLASNISKMSIGAAGAAAAP